MFDRRMLVADLARLGVAAGDILLVHSSFKALGPWRGTPADVVLALRELLGPKGTLLMPSFPSGSEFFLSLNRLVFDVRHSASGCGVITETFRRQPGVIRSLNPTHCTAGIGPVAAELLAGHEHCRISVGPGSPYHKLIEARGKILLLGVEHSSDTTLHFVENTNGAPTICRIEYANTIVDTAGREIPVPTLPHMPGLPRNYPRVDALLDAGNFQRRGLVGQADCRLVDAFGMAQCVGDAIRRDPLYLIEPFVFPEA